MICRKCAESDHDSCTAILRGAKTWCDCGHGHEQVLLKRRFGPAEALPAPSLDGEVVRLS